MGAVILILIDLGLLAINLTIKLFTVAVKIIWKILRGIVCLIVTIKDKITEKKYGDVGSIEEGIGVVGVYDVDECIV